MSADQAQTKRDWVLAALDEFESRLTRYALRLTNDAHAASDAVQHTFLRLCDETPAKLGGRLAPWLFAVCRNKALDLLRAKSNGAAASAAKDADQRIGREPDPAEAIESQELYLRLRSVVLELPASQREILDLWAEGFRYREIAEITSLREGTARVFLHRAFAALREHPTIRTLLDDREPEFVMEQDR